jgi:Peptidase family M23
MKYFIVSIFFCSLIKVYAQPQFELSQNVYRVPYASNSKVHISRDHLTHTPVGRYDMSGYDNGSSCSANYPIVAAAEGIVRRIVDNHNTKPPDCDPDCADFNNYVWIEHSNGEWSKYSHMKQFSTTVTAGLQVGDQVCAGTLLGYECEIGQAGGPHLHFEVRRPNDPANVQISVAGGFMSDAAHMIPVINTISKHFFDAGDDITASGGTTCGGIAAFVLGVNYNVPNNDIRIYMVSDNITTTSGTVINYQNGSNGMYQAGNSITISPGFTASPGSYFHARIAGCATTGFPGVCQ